MPLRILCDENIPGLVIATLKKWEYSVTTVTPGMTDAQVAEYAKKEQAIILTFDSDFANILAYPPQEYFGIVRIKIDPPLMPVVLQALKNLFKKLPKLELFQGKLFIVEADKIRVWEE